MDVENVRQVGRRRRARELSGKSRRKNMVKTCVQVESSERSKKRISNVFKKKVGLVRKTQKRRKSKKE
jgi:hypothetical protein